MIVENDIDKKNLNNYWQATCKVVKFNHQINKEVIKTADKKQLNTPIQADILDNFRLACKEYNLNMNVVLEALLKDFSNGNYSIIINRGNDIQVKKNI